MSKIRLAIALIIGTIGLIQAAAESQTTPSQTIPGQRTPPAPDVLPLSFYCRYPDASLRVGADGRTLLSFVIANTGDIGDVKVIHTSGNSDLDNAAVSCVQASHLNPSDPSFSKLTGSHYTMVHWTIPISPPGAPSASPFGQFLSIPHTCDGWYPPEALKAKIEGVTKLRFVIALDGTVTKLAVDTSSGNAQLDNAALSCASFWHYLPARQNGVAVEAPWTVVVQWKANADSLAKGDTSARRLQLGPHHCNGLDRIGGRTIVGLFITTAGTVEDIHVIESSGNAVLDKAAVACARTWRYVPATQDGVPIAVPWTAVINWDSPGDPPKRDASVPEK